MMFRQLLITLSLVLAVDLVAFPDLTADDEQPTLRVAVASNFLLTARTLSATFERQTGVKVLLSSASSGKLTTQIEAGAPYDLFLSADVARPERLIDNGFALSNSMAIYAIGNLVLVSRSQLKDPGDINGQRLAIANPKIAPYGLAAQQWLDNRNLQPKLIFGENINQVWHFYQVGAVAHAIVAKSQVLKVQPPPVHQVDLAVDGMTLAQAMVILKRSKSLDLARQFHQFLLSEAVQGQIQQAGYRIKAN